MSLGASVSYALLCCPPATPLAVTGRHFSISQIQALNTIPDTPAEAHGYFCTAVESIQGKKKKALAELSDCPRSITRLGTGCLVARCFASSKIHTSAIPPPTLLTSPAQPTACSQAGASLPITPVSSLSPGSWQGPCPPTPGTPPGPPPAPPAAAGFCFALRFCFPASCRRRCRCFVLLPAIPCQQAARYR